MVPELSPEKACKRPLSAELPSRLADDTFLNAKQAATYLGVSLATVRRLDWSGRLRFVAISDRRRAIRVADLRALAA